MLLRGLVRICCLVVMAPALVKAGNIFACYSLQIDSFASSLSVISCRPEKSLIDLISFVVCPTGYTGVSCYSWILNTSYPSKINISDGWISENQNHPNGVGDCTPSFCNPMMNRDISSVRDSMGLLGAHTSLDGDFKVRPGLERRSAFSTVEQELLVMSPREFEDPSDIHVFEVMSDAVDRRPPTPPESRPNSVPILATTTTAIRSLAELKMIENQTVSLKRRTENLIRRLRRLESEGIEFHVIRQLRAFVDHQQKNLGISCQKRTHHLTGKGVKESFCLKTEFLQNEDVRNLSTAALVKLVRKLESRGSAKLLQLHKGMLLDVENRVNNDKVLKLNSEESAEIQRTAGTLITNLKHLEFCMDSDMTESSSGGESCSEDEDNGCTGKKNTPLSIHRRSEWKWAVNRAAVARRWIWLQAQVSDLEYRIRQQNDIYEKLKANKDTVVFEDISTTAGNFNSSNCSQSSLNINVQSLKRKDDTVSETNNGIGTSMPLVNKHLKSVNGFFDSGTNGYHSVCGVLSTNSKSNHCSEQTKQPNAKSSLSYIYDAVHSSCRIRPIKSFKKRKLYRTVGLHLINRKASNLSTVRCDCNCQCEVSSCVLCGGRYNIMQTIDREKPVFERIALLDPSFHPVLSFNHDISFNLVLEKLISNMEIRKSVNQFGLYVKKKSHYSLSKSLNYQAKKHSLKLARNAAQTLLSSAKFRKNFCGRKHGTCKKLVTSKKRRGKIGRKKQHDFDILLPSRKRKYRRRSLSVASSGSSKPSSPIPCSSYSNYDSVGGQGLNSNGRSSILQDMLRRRRGESAFDIDNIVIPYSIASSTRVEKLQYKEILTPKWRLINEEIGIDVQENEKFSKVEEVEDIADSCYAERHQICEIDEKKKFATSYMKNKGLGRSRSRSRGDRADSSGANTPDPLSPHQLDILGQDSNSGLPINACSPINMMHMSSPLFCEDSQSSIGTPSFRTERKRTTSFSKKERSDEMQWDTEEMDEVVAPYESYVFPLSDDIYNKMLENSPHLANNVNPPSENFLQTPVGNPSSPLSSSSSESIPEEDPSDPEWTVISERGSHQSLVLKFAKR